MPCYAPMRAWRAEGGGPLIFGNPRGQCEVGEVTLPCGNCIGCRISRSRAWAVRIMCETQLHDFSSFVTLTYDDEHLPYGGSLHYPHFQLFMRRLRKAVGAVRFFVCGEYGDKEDRPHFHAILFGVGFDDRYPWRKSPAGHQLYRSALLESLWDFGAAEIGDVSFASAAYVARYCVKKVTGKSADAHYARLVPSTGEIIQLVPEFARMSLKPGIAGDWFDKYKSDVFPRDGVVIEGHAVPVPRYFLDRLSVEERSDYSMRRYNARLESWTPDGMFEDSPERLRVREFVALAGLNQSKRTL